MGSIIGTPLGWIIYVCYKVIPVYGVALILFAMIAKTLMFPLAVKQQKSMATMALFKPKMDALQKKYANNKEKYQEELQKLYTEEGYNPLSAGCLPLLIQLPIIYGLIDVVYKPLTHIFHVSSEFITQATEILTGLGVDTAKVKTTIQLEIVNQVHKNAGAFSSLDPAVIERIQNFNLNFLGINLGEIPTWTFAPIVLIPVLSGITSIVLSYISNKLNGSATQQNKGMNFMMMFIMPLSSVYFATLFPAGVGFYWLISNVYSIAQTIVLRKYYSPEKMAEKVAKENEAKREKRKATMAAVRDAQAKKKGLPAKGGAVRVGDLAVKEAPDSEEPEKAGEPVAEETLSAKELSRRKIAEARRRLAEKYGEEYVEEDEDRK